MLDRKLEAGQRLTLAIVFSLSMAVSHYTIGAISFYYFALGGLLIFMLRSSWGRRIWGWLTKKLGGLPASLVSPRAFPLLALAVVVVIYFVGSLAYYGWAASGKPLESITGISRLHATTVTSELPKLVPTVPERACGICRGK